MAHRDYGSFGGDIAPGLEDRDANPIGYSDRYGIFAPGSAAIAAQQNALLDAQDRALREAADSRQVGGALVEFPFGNVAKPNEKIVSLLGLKHVLRQGLEDAGGPVRGVDFSVNNFPAIDGIFAYNTAKEQRNEKSTCPAFDYNHPDYANPAFAALRRNIALWRNQQLVEKFSNGVYKGDENTPAGQNDRAKLAQITAQARVLAGEIRAGIKRKNLWSDELEFSDFARAVMVPDMGIAQMYEFLLDEQAKKSGSEKLQTSIAGLMGRKPSDAKWGLPPRSETAFSNDNLIKYSRSTNMMGIADNFDKVTKSLLSVDQMSGDDKKISIELAKEILDKLRVDFSDPSTLEEVSKITDPKQAEALQLLRVAVGIRGEIAMLEKVNPDFLYMDELAKAADAINILNYRVKVETHRMLLQEGHIGTPREGDNPPTGAARFEEEMRNTDPAFKISPKELPMTAIIEQLRDAAAKCLEINKDIPKYVKDLQGEEFYLKNRLSQERAKNREPSAADIEKFHVDYEQSTGKITAEKAGEDKKRIDDTVKINPGFYDGPSQGETQARGAQQARDAASDLGSQFAANARVGAVNNEELISAAATINAQRATTVPVTERERANDNFKYR